MKNKKELIGQKARRVSFSIQDSKDYFLLYSVVEILKGDMQDFSLFKENKKYCFRADSSSSKNKYNIYMTVDWFELSNEFISNPIENYYVFDTKYKFYTSGLKSIPSKDEPPYILQDSYQDDKADIQYVLPLRQCSKALYAYLDSEKIAKGILDANEYLKNQLSEISICHYGADLSLFPDHFGNIYIVQYNPYFRMIDFSSSPEPKGLYVNFKFRTNVNDTLYLRISNKNKAGFYSFEADQEIVTGQNSYFINLPSEPDVLSIKLLDLNGNLIYYNDSIRFIKSIKTRLGVKSKDVKLVTKSDDGEKSEMIEKFSSETHTIGETVKPSVELGETISTNAYKTLEDRLEFVLFDGDKNKKEENIAKAKRIVKDIIGKAHRRCIICDPYFNLNDLIEFVFSMRELNVDVRILSSKEYIGKNAKEGQKNTQAIKEAIENFTAKVGGSIQFRLLTGKSPLHDRFIVVDDNVWMLGSSLNEFGNRATTVYKVSTVSCRQVYGMAEQWWSDASFSISLSEYGNN